MVNILVAHCSLLVFRQPAQIPSNGGIPSQTNHIDAGFDVETESMIMGEITCRFKSPLIVGRQKRSMRNANSSLARNTSMMHLAAEPTTIRHYQSDVQTDIENFGKWPVWLRITLIVGLSASLWAGIIFAIGALL